MISFDGVSFSDGQFGGDELPQDVRSENTQMENLPPVSSDFESGDPLQISGEDTQRVNPLQTPPPQSNPLQTSGQEMESTNFLPPPQTNPPVELSKHHNPPQTSTWSSPEIVEEENIPTSVVRKKKSLTSFSPPQTTQQPPTNRIFPPISQTVKKENKRAPLISNNPPAEEPTQLEYYDIAIALHSNIGDIDWGDLSFEKGEEILIIHKEAVSTFPPSSPLSCSF